MAVNFLSDKCNTIKECLWSLCILVIAWRDACFRRHVTSKSVHNLHAYTFQFFCYVYLNLSMQFFDQRISTNHRGLVDVVWKRDRYTRAMYREALVQISPTTNKKRKKETGGTVWSVNEKGKKRNRQVGKE